MAIAPSHLLAAFPKLKTTGYKRTSPDTRDYNCLAWAAGETHRRWDPNAPNDYWPAKREQTIPAFKGAYATLGYVECENGDLEPGYEKIAIYAVGVKPVHAARQLANGAWTSKLGREIDIEHPTVEGVESVTYGKVVVFLKRRIILI